MKRRNFIGTTVSLSVAGISGCLNNTSSDTKTLESSEYPAGLSQDSVDLNTILSSDQAYLSSDSVTITIIQESGNGTTDVTAKVDSTVPAYRIRSENTFQDSQRVVDQYFNKNVFYLRESNSNSETYQKEQFQFEKRNEYYVNFIQNIFNGVSFSYHTVNEDGLLVYKTTSMSDFSEESQFTGTDVVDATVRVTFKPNGLFDSIKTTVKRSIDEEESNERTYVSEQTVTFSKYNSTTVSEPNWIDTARQRT